MGSLISKEAKQKLLLLLNVTILSKEEKQLNLNTADYNVTYFQSSL